MSSSIVSDEMKACTGQQLQALKPLKDAPQLWTVTLHYMCSNGSLDMHYSLLDYIVWQTFLFDFLQSYSFERGLKYELLNLLNVTKMF